MFLKGGGIAIGMVVEARYGWIIAGLHRDCRWRSTDYAPGWY